MQDFLRMLNVESIFITEISRTLLNWNNCWEFWNSQVSGTWHMYAVLHMFFFCQCVNQSSCVLFSVLLYLGMSAFSCRRIESGSHYFRLVHVLASCLPSSCLSTNFNLSLNFWLLLPTVFVVDEYIPFTVRILDDMTGRLSCDIEVVPVKPNACFQTKQSITALSRKCALDL